MAEVELRRNTSFNGQFFLFWNLKVRIALIERVTGYYSTFI